MKKTDIREGETYRNKSGSACREVLSITTDPDAVKAATPLYGCVDYDPAPWVIYRRSRGPDTGEVAASSVASFASWAHSPDSGPPSSTADLRKRVDELEAALRPFAKLGAEPPKPGYVWRDVHISDLRTAAEVMGTLPDHLKTEAAK